MSRDPMPDEVLNNLPSDLRKLVEDARKESQELVRKTETFIQNTEDTSKEILKMFETEKEPAEIGEYRKDVGD